MTKSSHSLTVTLAFNMSGMHENWESREEEEKRFRICKNYNVTFDWKYMMTVIIIKRAGFQKSPPIWRISIMSWCYYLWMNRDVISNHDFLVPYNKKECHEIFYQNWSNQFNTLERRIKCITRWFDIIRFRWKFNWTAGKGEVTLNIQIICGLLFWYYIYKFWLIRLTNYSFNWISRLIYW